MLQTLVLIAALSMAVTTLLETQLLFAKIAIRRTAEAYLTAETGVATQALLKQLGGSVIANGPGTAFTVPPLAPQCVGTTAACALKVSATYAVTGSTIGTTAGTAVAENLETDVLSQEARSSIEMTVAITDATGTPLVTRMELLTVRTFDVPPYAAIVGVADAAAPTALTAEGDAAGCAPGNPASCDPNAGTVDDTRIDDQRSCLENQNGGSCTGAPTLDVSTFGNPNWPNGNVAIPGWAR